MSFHKSLSTHTPFVIPHAPIHPFSCGFGSHSSFNPTYCIDHPSFEALLTQLLRQNNCSPPSGPGSLQLSSSLAYPISNSVLDMRGILYLLHFAATPGLPFPQHRKLARCAWYSVPSSLLQRNAIYDVRLFWTMVLFRLVSHVQSIEAVADSFVIPRMQVFTAVRVGPVQQNPEEVCWLWQESFYVLLHARSRITGGHRATYF